MRHSFTGCCKSCAIGTKLLIVFVCNRHAAACREDGQFSDRTLLGISEVSRFTLVRDDGHRESNQTSLGRQKVGVASDHSIRASRCAFAVLND